MTPKQLQKHMIKRNNKSAYTKPEMDFAAFAKEKGFDLAQNAIVAFLVEGKRFDFQMDFVKRHGFKFWEIQVDIEIDGKGHKAKWDHWKDEIKAANGIKVIHVPGELTKKNWWFYLNSQLKKALESKEMVIYIDG